MRHLPILLLLLAALCCPGTPAWADTDPLADLPAATWLGSQWLKGASDADVARLVTDLEDLGITVLYPRVEFEAPTTIPGSGGRLGWVPEPAAARRFVENMRTAIPGIRIIPYKGWHGCDWLADDTRRQAIVDAVEASVDAVGADGFQLDVECDSIDGDHAQALAVFLDEVKQRLGPDRTLSVAIPILCQEGAALDEAPFGDAPWHGRLTSHPAPRRYCRTPQTWETVFAQADQVAVMIYDTWYLHEQAELYVELTAGQVWAGAWYAARHDAEFLPGLRFSTVDAKHPDHGRFMHLYSVENPIAGWVGVRGVAGEAAADGEAVSDHLAGIAYFRLDVMYRDSYRPEDGAPFLEAIRARGAAGGP